MEFSLSCLLYLNFYFLGIKSFLLLSPIRGTGQKLRAAYEVGCEPSGELPNYNFTIFLMKIMGSKGAPNFLKTNLPHKFSLNPLNKFPSSVMEKLCNNHKTKFLIGKFPAHFSLGGI